VHLGLAAFALARIRVAAPPMQREPFEPMPQQASPAALQFDPRRDRPGPA
jgi:hypothetical protein